MRFGWLLTVGVVGALSATSTVARDDVVGQLATVTVQGRSDSAPRADSSATLYPDTARRAGIDGVVVLNCAVQPRGHFDGCVTLREEPEGQGFAAAAAAIVPHIVQPMKDSRGREVSSGYAVIPFNFVVEDVGSRLIGLEVVWDRRPTGLDMAEAYPPAAAAAGREARTRLSCTVQDDGALSACMVSEEAPFGWGFDKAALALARKFHAAPKLKNGSPRPAGLRVRIPVAWRLPHS